MGQKVQFFVTCMADLFRPQAGQAAVRVLERHGFSVAFPTGQTCCGQFSLNAGFVAEATQMARHFIETFEPDEAAIVGISGSCVAMVVHEYPRLLQSDPDWEERGRRIASRTYEWSQWLNRTVTWDDAPRAQSSVVHHGGCHMRRLLQAADDPRVLLEHLGVEAIDPDEADQCCGFGGTYSMTEPQVSTALADAKWTAVDEAAGRVSALALTGADLGCLLHLKGRAARVSHDLPVWYVAEIVDRVEQQAWDAETAQRGGILPDEGTTTRK